MNNRVIFGNFELFLWKFQYVNTDTSKILDLFLTIKNFIIENRLFKNLLIFIISILYLIFLCFNHIFRVIYAFELYNPCHIIVSFVSKFNLSR